MKSLLSPKHAGKQKAHLAALATQRSKSRLSNIENAKPKKGDASEYARMLENYKRLLMEFQESNVEKETLKAQLRSCLRENEQLRAVRGSRAESQQLGFNERPTFANLVSEQPCQQCARHLKDKQYLVRRNIELASQARPSRQAGSQTLLSGGMLRNTENKIAKCLEDAIVKTKLDYLKLQHSKTPSSSSSSLGSRQARVV